MTIQTGRAAAAVEGWWRATPEIIAPFVGGFAEAVEGHFVGFVWKKCAAIDDFGAKSVAIVGLVANEGRHGRREFQKGGPAAIRVTQGVDYRGPPTARAADFLFMRPLL